MEPAKSQSEDCETPLPSGPANVDTSRKAEVLCNIKMNHGKIEQFHQVFVRL